MMTKEQVFDEFKIAKNKDIAKSTSKPSKVFVETFGVSDIISLSINSLISVVNSDFFEGLTTTPIKTSSKTFEHLLITSMCPLVGGSNEPGISTFIISL